MTKLVEWTAALGRRDAALDEFLKGKQSESTVEHAISLLEEQLTVPSHYVSKTGATVQPRPLWVVEAKASVRRAAGGVEDIVPLRREGEVEVRTSRAAVLVQGQGKRKEPWRGLVLEGPLCPDNLFGLITSRYVTNFSVVHRDICVVPASVSGGHLEVLHALAKPSAAGVTLEELEPCKSLLRKWIQKAQRDWDDRKGDDKIDLCTERFDLWGGLGSQPPKAIRVVHTRSGDFRAALLNPSGVGATGLPFDKLVLKYRRGGRVLDTVSFPIPGLILDNLVHWIGVRSAQEGDWLVGILNSRSFVKRLWKEVYPKRDVYAWPGRVLQKLGFVFNPTNKRDLQIAADARLIARSKLAFDRGYVRGEMESADYASIDDSQASARPPRLGGEFESFLQQDKESSIAFERINKAVDEMM